jgi:hypothetical protein
MESIKKYKAILLTVLGVVIVVAGAYAYMRGHKSPVKEAVVKSTMMSFTGSVSRMYEGENKLVYSFDIPSGSTTTTTMDGALVHVTNGSTLYLAMYLSYEGGRGYSAEDYIKNVIVPQVRVLNITGTTTLGTTVWTTAESQNTEWHVGQVGNGQWLMVVESPKVSHDDVVSSIESMKTE